jgi:hypothetical protein
MRFKVGAWISVGWIMIMIMVAVTAYSPLQPMKPNEWGDFFSGFFAPLAFLWLVLGYLQQGDELQLSTKCVGSMSRKGNCWDNAAMERFFLSLKTERVWRRTYANQHEAVADVGDYIVNFYNEKRLHSAIGYMTPNQFEQQFDN